MSVIHAWSIMVVFTFVVLFMGNLGLTQGVPNRHLGIVGLLDPIADIVGSDFSHYNVWPIPVTRSNHGLVSGSAAG